MNFTDTVCMYPSPTATLSPFALIVLSYSDVPKATVADYHVLQVPLSPLQLQMMLT